MKKIYVSIFLSCFVFLNLWAANITVKMNSFSTKMELVIKNDTVPLDVGLPQNGVYTFTMGAGFYTLIAKDATEAINGKIDLEFTDEADQSFIIHTVVASLTNAGWDYETHYDVTHTVGNSAGYTLGGEKGTKDGKASFVMLNGDTYFVRFDPKGDKIDAGYMFNSAFGTVTENAATGNTVTVEKESYIGTDFTLTVDKDATVFLGRKRGTKHYVPFDAVTLKNETTVGTKKTYTYNLSNNNTYNYRVKQAGKITRAGKIGFQIGKCESVDITAIQPATGLTPTKIERSLTANEMLNVADIYLNINRQGLLRLPAAGVNNQPFQIVNLRTWQIIDDFSNNYFMEPDYKYTVLNENFQSDSTVVKIDEKGILIPISNGIAIVQVTYDALYAWQYNVIDGFGTKNIDKAFEGGAFWSALWPENTGTFVVTVGQEQEENEEDEEPSMKPNIVIPMDPTGAQEAAREVDAEHDIFYYLEGEDGYKLTFKPEGVSTVELANPHFLLNDNIASYSGFSAENVTKNADNSFTVILKHGRNIIRMSSLAGEKTYQVLSAKPVEYKFTPSSGPYKPGDVVKVQADGLYHPANKLAGIYNMTAHLYYNDAPIGTDTILGPGQYNFAGNPAARSFSIEIPQTTASNDTLRLKKGSLRVMGYGYKPPFHRGINYIIGRNPNFTAEVHLNYWGAIPDVIIPYTSASRQGIRHRNVSNEKNLYNQEGALYPLSEDTNLVYPNPFADYIILRLAAESQVQIYDLFGKLLFSEKMPAGQNKINTTHFVKGTYFIKYGTETKQLIK